MKTKKIMSEVLSVSLLSISLGIGYLYSPSVNACDETICGKEMTDFDELQAEIEELQEKNKEEKKSAFKKMLDEIYAMKDELPGKECLDGLMQVDIAGTVVGDAVLPNMMKALLEQLIGAACAAATKALNEQITLANKQFNDYGKELKEKSGGLANFKSTTRTDGKPSTITGSLTTLQDSDAMKDLNKKWNNEFNKKVYGDTQARPSDINLQDDRYYPEGNAENVTTKKIEIDIQKTIESKIKDAACWVTEDCVPEPEPEKETGNE